MHISVLFNTHVITTQVNIKYSPIMKKHSLYPLIDFVPHSLCPKMTIISDLILRPKSCSSAFSKSVWFRFFTTNYAALSASLNYSFLLYLEFYVNGIHLLLWLVIHPYSYCGYCLFVLNTVKYIDSHCMNVPVFPFYFR